MNTRVCAFPSITLKNLELQSSKSKPPLSIILRQFRVRFHAFVGQHFSKQLYIYGSDTLERFSVDFRNGFYVSSRFAPLCNRIRMKCFSYKELPPLKFFSVARVRLDFISLFVELEMWPDNVFEKRFVVHGCSKHKLFTVE